MILGLSTILQLVCLVAPGWWIQTFKYRYDGSTMYEALFYLITCKDSHCETVSWLTFWEKDDAGKTE